MNTRIILADDHQLGRQGLRSLLQREPDLEVAAEAADGHSTVRLVRELQPDLVILDLALPDLQGPEAVRRLLAASPGVRLIGLSLYADRRFVVNILRAGASGYLLKDCAFEELVAAIRAVLAHRTYISRGLSDLVLHDYVVALRESEGLFRTIFQGSPLGMALLDLDGRLLDGNPVLQAMVGRSHEELVRQRLVEVLGFVEAEACLAVLLDFAHGRRTFYQGQHQYRRKDGQTAWGRVTITSLPSPGGLAGVPHLAIAMVEDVNDQKKAEAEIRLHQERLRSMALELSLTEERERRRLATDLHDHVGQILALAQIKLGGLRESAGNSHLAAGMDEVRQLVEQTIRYTRSLTFELSPPILYDLGFEAAVEWLAELLQEQHAVPIQVHSDRSPKPLEEQLRVLLFQAMRELLLHFVKQGRCRKIAVTLERQGADLLIRVSGEAMDVADLQRPAAEGLMNTGLFGIRERLKYLGGNLEEDNPAGQCPQVTLTAPLKN